MSLAELSHQTDHHRARYQLLNLALTWAEPMWSPRARDLAAPGSMASPDLLPPPRDMLPRPASRVSDSGHHTIGSQLESEIKPWRFTPTLVGARGGVSLQSLKSGWSSWQRWQHCPLCLLGCYSMPRSFVWVPWPAAT